MIGAVSDFKFCGFVGNFIAGERVGNDGVDIALCGSSALENGGLEMLTCGERIGREGVVGVCMASGVTAGVTMPKHKKIHLTNNFLTLLCQMFSLKLNHKFMEISRKQVAQIRQTRMKLFRVLQKKWPKPCQGINL